MLVGGSNLPEIVVLKVLNELLAFGDLLVMLDVAVWLLHG